MEIKRNFKLIEGTFTPEEARRLLYSLVDSKIRFHQMERFSNQERYGSDINHSGERILQLEKLYTELDEALDYALTGKYNLKVTGPIEITFVNP